MHTSLHNVYVISFYIILHNNFKFISMILILNVNLLIILIISIEQWITIQTYLISETDDRHYLQNLIRIVWPDLHDWYRVVRHGEAFVNYQPYDVYNSYTTNRTCITQNIQSLKKT